MQIFLPLLALRDRCANSSYVSFNIPAPYMPTGPQTMVPFLQVQNSNLVAPRSKRWLVCHRQTYDTRSDGDNLSSGYYGSKSGLGAIMKSCSRKKILMSCRRSGSEDIEVLAIAPRSDVFKVTGFYLL